MVAYKDFLNKFGGDNSYADRFWAAYKNGDNDLMSSIVNEYNGSNSGSVKTNTTKNKTNTNTVTNNTNNTSTIPTVDYNGSSITEYLKKAGIDSSFANRAKLAKQYGISNYSGTAAQNLKLLDLLKKGGTGTSTSGTNMSGHIDLSNQPEGVNHGTNLNENISYNYNGRDYGSDDQDRLDQMRAHIEEGYIKTKPELFMDRNEYNKFFHYNDRTSQAQKDLLDEMREKYGVGKSDASPTDTKILTDEKEFEQQKRDDKLSTLQDIVDQLNNSWGDIKDEMSGDFKKAKEDLDNIINEYMGKLGDLQDFYNGYYQNMLQDYNRMMNGEISGLASDLSGKGMTGVMRNSINGIRRNYSKMVNSLLKEKNDLDDQLAKGLADLKLNVQKEKDVVDNNKYSMFVDGYDRLKATLDALSAAQQQSIDDMYRSRENRYKARSDETADTGGNAAKKESKSSIYRGMNFNQRAQYLNDNLVTIIGDGTTLDNYNYNVIKYAAENYNDLTEALHYIAQNAKYDKTKAISNASSINSDFSNSFISAYDKFINDGGSVDGLTDYILSYKSKNSSNS